ncbi:coiled-coil domain-containing protein SCD2 [Cinnamomum micranthum f. kanehirae]|uniref:Coiled-coil domain-containing protein SCD2 n=1 Tax=Cinnamomum micranthum f. kanehirae TaxID=337451 RepID=A0A443NNK5_9MAGN|nr:coiled-coil domain-containing protein SCD2 [Cinnamomum micranthum f. kanehirae]
MQNITAGFYFITPLPQIYLCNENIAPSSSPFLPPNNFPDRTMDRRRAGSPVYSRQRSGESTGSSSPGMSPAHHRSASAAGSFSSIKRTQNVAAKAAAQRLAQVMASQAAGADDDDDDDDLTAFHYKAPPPSMPRLSNNNAGSIPPATISGSRAMRSPSPARILHLFRSASTGRPSISVRSNPLVPPSRTSLRTPNSIPPIEPPNDRRREKKREKQQPYLSSSAFSGAGGTQRAVELSETLVGCLLRLKRTTTHATKSPDPLLSSVPTFSSNNEEID